MEINSLRQINSVKVLKLSVSVVNQDHTRLVRVNNTVIVI